MLDLTEVQTEDIVTTPGTLKQNPEPSLGSRYIEGFTGIPDLSTVLTQDPSLARSAFRCLLAAKAPGTIRS